MKTREEHQQAILEAVKGLQVAKADAYAAGIARNIAIERDSQAGFALLAAETRLQEALREMRSDAWRAE